MISSVTKTKKLPAAGAKKRADMLLGATALILGILGTLMVFTAGYAYAEAKYDDPFYFIKRQVKVCRELCLQGVPSHQHHSRIDEQYQQRNPPTSFIHSCLFY